MKPIDAFDAVGLAGALALLYEPDGSFGVVRESVAGANATIANPNACKPSVTDGRASIRTQAIDNVLTTAAGLFELDADESGCFVAWLRSEDVQSDGLPANLGVLDSGQSGTNGRLAIYTVGTTLFGLVTDDDGSSASSSIAGSRAKGGQHLLAAFVLDREADTLRTVLVDEEGLQLGASVDAAAIGTVSQPLTGLLLDTRSTNGWDGHGLLFAFLRGAAPSPGQLAELFRALRLTDPNRRHFDYPGSYGDQGIAIGGGHVFTSTGGGFIHRHELNGTYDTGVQVSNDVAFNGFTGHPWHHWGGIDFGDGWLWGLIGAQATVSWLARIDPDTLAVDRAWDLNAQIGGLHSSGDPVAFIGGELATEVWYATPAFLHRLSIDAVDTVSLIESHGLTLGQGALFGYGMPQGLNVIDLDDPQAGFLLSLYATGGWAGPADGWLEARIDAAGEVRPVQFWAHPQLPPGAHVEDVQILSVAGDGSLAVLHTELTRAARYTLAPTPQRQIRSLLEGRGLIRWYPLEWNGLDYLGDGATDGALTGNASFNAAESPESAHNLGSLDIPIDGTSWLQLDVEVMPTGPADDWWILVFHRSYDNGGAGGSISSIRGILGRADPLSGGLRPNYIVLGTNASNVFGAIRDPSGTYFGVAGTAQDTRSGAWHCSVLAYEGDSQTLKWWDVCEAGLVTDTNTDLTYTGVVQSGTAWRIGHPANSGLSAWEGAIWGVGFGTGRMDTETVRTCFEIARGTLDKRLER